MEEHWHQNFERVREFYEKHGHLTLDDKVLSQWLTYQRLHAKNLSDRQLALLDSIHYKDTPIFRQSDEMEWEEMYNKLRYWRTEHGTSKALSKGLSCWVSRQKRKSQDGKLGSEKRQKLEELGVDFSSFRMRNCGIRDPVRWNVQFQKLESFRDKHGHCDVPKRYENDLSLGSWVCAQRQKYRKLHLRGEPLDANWIKRLDAIGFAWSRKPDKSTKRSRSGVSNNNKP